MSDYLTPAEIADLRIIAGRARMDGGDIYPMRRVFARTAGFRHEEVIPWRDAIEMEVGCDD